MAIKESPQDEFDTLVATYRNSLTAAQIGLTTPGMHPDAMQRLISANLKASARLVVPVIAKMLAYIAQASGQQAADEAMAALSADCLSHADTIRQEARKLMTDMLGRDIVEQFEKAFGSPRQTEG